jgi:hypothetical protein
MEIFTASTTFFVGIVITLFGFIAVHRLGLYRDKINIFSKEAARFRSSILGELKGLYPITHHWGQEEINRIKQSAQKIESLAVEFRHYVIRKDKFDKTLKQYNDYCNEISWEKCAAYVMYPSMRKPGDKEPKDKFRHIIEELLAYAK